MHDWIISSHMPALLHIASRLSAILVLSVALGADCKAQAPEGSVVYRFKVQGVEDHAAAKPFLHTLMEAPAILRGEFILECGCFKVAAAEPMSYHALSHKVAQAGYRLLGAVEGSDGTQLSPPEPIER